MSRSNDGLTYLAVAVGAGLVGLMAGLLLAPASGRETRRRLVRKASEGREALARKGRRAAESVADYASARLKEGKEKLSGIVSP